MHIHGQEKPNTGALPAHRLDTEAGTCPAAGEESRAWLPKLALPPTMVVDAHIHHLYCFLQKISLADLAILKSFSPFP